MQKGPCRLYVGWLACSRLSRNVLLLHNVWLECFASAMVHRMLQMDPDTSSAMVRWT